MNDSRDSSPTRAAPPSLPLLWGSALTVAGLGAWLLFDAEPGLNWLLWTTAAVAGLQAIAAVRRGLETRAAARSRSAGRRAQSTRAELTLGGVTVVVAGAASVTASPALCALISLSVMLLLAVQMRLAVGGSLESITPAFVATAPPLALWTAARETLQRGVEATQRIQSHRARAWVRGLVITVPVLVGFALLLAGADPVLAQWRDLLSEVVGRWDAAPRVSFFALLLVVVLGAYGYAAGNVPYASLPLPSRAPWFGATERLMLLSGVAALLWVFLGLQLRYLFGELPGTTASGLTFAEYARRGFGELTVVASASALLIVISERYGVTDARARTMRLLTMAIIGAVLLLLGSALRRVWLYEAAYGYTTARLYAQVYMTLVAVGLVLLSREVLRDFDAGRVFRRALTVATVAFVSLGYWNHEAWIADRNIDRFFSEGTLDVAYLTEGLSLNAVPTIASRLPDIPEPVRSELRNALSTQLAKRLQPRHWYEWNFASHRAARAADVVLDAPARHALAGAAGAP